MLGRVVLGADGPEGSPSVRAFRHEGLALVVEGQVPAQLDAVITAWLTELASAHVGGALRRASRTAVRRREALAAHSWTSSMRVPKLPLGWTKATVVPRLPGRGALSIGVAPAATIASRAAAQSSTR